MKRVKKKYQTPVIHSIELGPICPVTASIDVSIDFDGNASSGCLLYTSPSPRDA